MYISYRNPFALRASEKITDDSTFLSLFSIESLQPLNDLYDRGVLWNNVIRICSAPGGGKTSLLRVFSPAVLTRLTTHHHANNVNKQMYSCLKRLEVLGDKTYRKCGAYLLIDRDFAYIWELELPEPKRKKIFYALLNSRVCLTVVKTIMQLKNLSRKDWTDVTYTPPALDFACDEIGITDTCTLDKLYIWSSTLEDKICNYLDAISLTEPTGNKSIFAFNLFKAEYFKYKGESICEEFIFMLDDAHKFGKELHNTLFEQVVETRGTASIFLSQRKEVLPAEDLINKNNKEGRDFQEIVLDKGNNDKILNKIYNDISTSRSILSEYQIGYLPSLEEEVTADYDDVYTKIIEEQKKYIESLSLTSYFVNWYNHIDKKDESLRVKASYYKAMAIIAARWNARLFPYEVDEMSSIITRDLLSLAKALMVADYDVPMFYGQDDVKDLATYNVEQFISFASKMYDKLIGKYINGETVTLEAKDQSDAIAEVCKDMYEKIRLLPNGSQVVCFLNHLLNYCHDVTFDEKSSYRVVSGFAVNARNERTEWYKNEEYQELAEVIRICIANNLLTVKDITQGAVGEVWKVYYLNRFICAHKRIPLSYGGWRKLRVNDLKSWLKDDGRA